MRLPYRRPVDFSLLGLYAFSLGMGFQWKRNKIVRLVWAMREVFRGQTLAFNQQVAHFIAACVGKAIGDFRWGNRVLGFFISFISSLSLSYDA
jgi:hypothetical protein